MSITISLKGKDWMSVICWLRKNSPSYNGVTMKGTDLEVHFNDSKDASYFALIWN